MKSFIKVGICVLEWTKWVQVVLEKSSSIVKKYVAPDKEECLYGPQRSTWTKWKIAPAWEVEIGKGELWDLAKIQGSQQKICHSILFEWNW